MLKAMAICSLLCGFAHALQHSNKAFGVPVFLQLGSPEGLGAMVLVFLLPLSPFLGRVYIKKAFFATL